MRRPDQRIDPLVLSRVVPDTWIDVNKLVGLEDGDEVRGLGHTRHQMLTAPKGAAFVWCRNDTRYAETLKRHLEREDLVICPANWLSGGAERTPHNMPIVVDHAYQDHQKQR